MFQPILLCQYPVNGEGEGTNIAGKEKGSNKILVKVSKEFFRPIKAENFLGDYSKAKRVLGWKPKTKFKYLVKIMLKMRSIDLKIRNKYKLVLNRVL